jgi:hypothetical protein
MVGNLLVALVLLSGEIDVRATATAESRAGEAPNVAGSEPSAFFAEIVTPAAMFAYREPGLTFQATYSPRVYWQEPNLVSSLAPLLLHTADLRLEAKSTRRLTLGADLSGSIGKADYSQIGLLLGSAQPGQQSSAVPQVLEIASATGSLAARVTITRRWELDLHGQGLYWKSLGAVAGATLNITEQRSAGEQASAFYRLTPNHALGFGAAGSEASFSNGLDIYTIGPTVTWKAQLTPRDQLTLTVGLSYVRATGMAVSGTMPLLGPSGQAASPVGGFDLVSQLSRRDEFFILANASGGVDYYVDPVLGIAAPRARAGGGITAFMAPDWMAIVRGDFATAIRSTPLTPVSTGIPPVSSGYYPDETLVSLTASVRRSVNPFVFAELGGLWAERAPAFVTPDFQFRERQLWVFARLTWMSHPLPRQVQVQ